ncbi:MAG: phosphoribosylamine--glycine ligase [Pseudomonadota bacterium]
MRVLIVGSGGREHAMAWQCAQGEHIEQVIVVPGNPGTASEPKVRNKAADIADNDALIAVAKRESVDLMIVGPEQPLVNGLVDACQSADIACFGPTASGAQLEGSKSFTKAFLQRHGIPTASYATFEDFESARAHIEQRGAPCVVKADGLAAGKGVVVAQTTEAAIEAAEDMLVDERFGGASQRIVVEDFLVGEEASLIAVTDGTHVVPLASSQDHKARDNGDRGPNTGGMGAYSPAPVLSGTVLDRAVREILEPTVAGLRADGINYVGILYAGLMIDDSGQARVLEYNCRLGDPETQPIMRRLRTPLDKVCTAAINGTLTELTIHWDERASSGVVMAAEGYPGSATTGNPINGLSDAEALDTVKVFQAGTRRDSDALVTAGGRVLCVTALGDNITSASRAAYAGVEAISWQGAFYREDIGHRAISRERDA